MRNELSSIHVPVYILRKFLVAVQIGRPQAEHSSCSELREIELEAGEEKVARFHSRKYNKTEREF